METQCHTEGSDLIYYTQGTHFSRLLDISLFQLV